jgi:hypothetical protein
LELSVSERKFLLDCECRLLPDYGSRRTDFLNSSQTDIPVNVIIARNLHIFNFRNSRHVGKSPTPLAHDSSYLIKGNYGLDTLYMILA